MQMMAGSEDKSQQSNKTSEMETSIAKSEQTTLSTDQTKPKSISSRLIQLEQSVQAAQPIKIVSPKVAEYVPLAAVDDARCVQFVTKCFLILQ